MRSAISQVRYSEGVKGFVKSYSGGKYGFVGLLPDEGTDIYAFADSLNGEKWLSLWESRNASKGEISGVRVGIPEFSYGVKTKLNDTLKAMGMTDMFDETLADFSGGDQFRILSRTQLVALYKAVKPPVRVFFFNARITF